MTTRWTHDARAVPGRRSGRVARALRRVVPAFAAVTAALCVWPAAAPAQTAAELSADASDGYARLELRFPEALPEHEIRVTTGVVVVRFEEAVDVDAADLETAVPDYVSAARLDPDGRAVRFALAQAVTVNTMEAGDRLFVDLLPRDWVGRPPGLPQEVIDELARRAAEAERRREEEERRRLIEAAPAIELRIAHLPTFTRFTFVWEEPVDARLERAVDTATVAFERFARLDPTGTLALLPDYVAGIAADNGEGGLEVRFDVDPGATVRGFREDATYVVDVGVPPDADGGADAAMPAPPAGAVAQMRALGAGGGDRPVPSADAAGEPTSSEVRVLHRRFGAPKRAGGAPSPDGRPAERDGAAASPGGDPASGAVRAEARRFGSSVRLVFPFDETTPSAVFEKAGTLWIVFDTDRGIDAALLRDDLVEFVDDVEVDRAPGRAILRLRLARPLLATAKSEATSWIVSLGDAVLDPAAPVDVFRRLGPDGGEVVMELPGAHDRHVLRDGESGERLFVVTTEPPARAVVKPQRFVDFTALPTVHGVAVRQVADDLSVDVESPEVVISRVGGLVLSEVGSGRFAAGGEAERAVQRPGFVDLNSDAVLDPGVVHGLISGYVRAAAEAKEEDRTQARMHLARALLATDLGAEALAQLDLIAREDAAVLREPEVRALRGIAMTMMHRPEDAIAEFDTYGLTQSSDVALWRAVAEAERGRWRAAETAFERGRSALASYSDGRQLMFRFAGARAAVELADLEAAASRVAELRDMAPPGDERLRLLEGRLAEAQGASTDALRDYDAVADSHNRMLSAEARLRATRLRHELDAIGIDEAIAELETLSVVWRGDETELTTLRFLAGLYVDKGEYRKAFRLMKSATVADPESRATRGLQDDMNVAFEDLFLKGGAAELGPVDALALYYDFRELTPVGRKGDEMIRRLADRLIEVDLLKQATELLTHQVQHRLNGAARAQVAATLAMVHLMNRQPEAALAVLSRSRQQVLPQAVQRQRRLLEARALAETDRTDLALDLLSALEGENVVALRADTLWRAERWQEAAEAHEAILDDRWDAAGALDVTDRRRVMRAAIGYALAPDVLGLERLRGKFLAKMSDSPDARAFDVVTRPMPETAGEFRSVVRELAATDTLDAFLADYRERYGAAGLDEAPQS